MISVSGKKWKEKKINKNLVEKLKQEENFSEILAKIIITRNFDKDEIYSINNEIKFNNIFQKNNDYEKSINIVTEAIYNKDKICILGDYDVDGSASTSLLVNFFKHINHPHFYYIPDREKDGYGASVELFSKLITKKPKLVIMLDCGSNSSEAVSFLNNLNIKSVIIDHHEINKPFPLAGSIINPKKNNGYENYDYLCATTLTYFFLDLLIKKIKSNFIIKDFLIYVLLATVCDVMPLRKLNRLIATKALSEFNLNKNIAFKKIYEIAEKKNKISINDLGYFLGPILNSGGRLGKSNYATELLSTSNEKVIEKLSNELIKLNEKRKKIEEKILDEIDFKKLEIKNNNVIIVYDPNINEGLLGIIAARLKDYFSMPALVITNSKNILKGSARSIANFNIGAVIQNAFYKKIIKTGGGHKMAAGFSLEKNNFKNFSKFIENSYLKLNLNNKKDFSTYDSKVSSIAFNKIFYDHINQLKPFGNHNEEPLFLFEQLKILKPKIIKKKHISSFLKSKSGHTISSLSFNSINSNIGEYLLNYKDEINVIGQIKENFWNNKTSLQLIVKDIIIYSNKT